MPDRDPTGPEAVAARPGRPAVAPPVAGTGRISRPVLGILFMLAATATFSSNDVMLKWLTDSYPPAELMSVRGGFTVIWVLLFAGLSGGLRRLRIHSLRGQGWRAACAVASQLAFLSALPVLPLADLVALFFAAPLFITLLAPIMLGERNDWYRWVAVTLGFAGVLIMARPTGAFSVWFVALPLVAALFSALRDLLTRKMMATESWITTLLVTSTGFIIIGAAAAPLSPWRMPTGIDLALFAASGLLYTVANYFTIESYRMAQAALVSPLRYSALLWATLYGFLIWGHVPGVATVIGAAIVAASGMFILRRALRRPR